MLAYHEDLLDTPILPTYPSIRQTRHDERRYRMTMSDSDYTYTERFTIRLRPETLEQVKEVKMRKLEEYPVDSDISISAILRGLILNGLAEDLRIPEDLLDRIETYRSQMQRQVRAQSGIDVEIDKSQAVRSILEMGLDQAGVQDVDSG